MNSWRTILLLFMLLGSLMAFAACGDDDDDDNDDSAVDDDDDDDNDDDDDDNDGPSDEEGVFIAKTGSDDNPGTKAQPLLTVAAGVALAEADDKAVYIASGEYPEEVITTVSLYGGYDENDWSRNSIANRTTLLGEGVALTIAGDDEVVIDGLTIKAYGEGSTGVVADNPLAVLHQNTIDGGVAVGDEPIKALTYYRGVEIHDGAVLIDNVITGGGAGESSVSYAVYVEGTALLVNNVLYAADDAETCSNINLFGAAEVTLINNILYSGPFAASYAAVEVEVDESALQPSVVLYNNDVWGLYLQHLVAARYVTEFYYSDDLPNLNGCVWFGCTEAVNNLSADPQLGSDNAHIASTSPCVEGGVNPATWYNGNLADEDVDGQARPSGEWDIGVDEVYAN